MFTFIIIAVLAASIYVWYGLVYRTTKDYVAPAAITTVKVTASTGLGLVRDVRALHIENEMNNEDEMLLASTIRLHSRAAEMDKAVSSVFDHRGYRHGALDRLKAAEAKSAARKAA